MQNIATSKKSFSDKKKSRIYQDEQNPKINETDDYDSKNDRYSDNELDNLGIYDSMTPLVEAVTPGQEQNSLIKVISNSDVTALESHLKHLPPTIDLTEIINKESGYSLLHLAVFKDSDQIALMLCKHVMERQCEPKEIKIRKLRRWINKKTEGKEGFTPLHIASFNGNLPLIRFLERHGADVFAENNFSLNALHVAAQGNQPPAIVYFLNKNFDINSRDRVRSTPLHWACYAGAENAVSYLIAYNADPNLQDMDGYSPLHLAIKSAESIKSSRIVKQLLFSGADRNLLNCEGLKPMDYAKSITINHIAHDIKRSLSDPKYCSCLLLSQPLTKMRREPYTAIYFVLLILISY
jgi:hypothetical protein